MYSVLVFCAGILFTSVATWSYPLPPVGGVFLRTAGLMHQPASLEDMIYLPSMGYVGMGNVGIIMGACWLVGQTCKVEVL